MPKITRSLAFRLFFLLLLVSTIAFISLTMFIIRANSRHLMQEIFVAAQRTNELIQGSIHYSMLLNRKEDVARIIDTLGSGPGVEGIRIYNKKGVIAFSSNHNDVGQAADLKAEQCIVCHSSERPLEFIPEATRPRIFSSAQGSRVLAVINPIRNESACAAPACHPSPFEQKILGVLDSKMSLVQVDQNILTSRNQMILYSIGAIVVIELFAGLFIWWMVHQRVVKLAEGTREVRKGNLDFRVKVRGKDEIADLACSFNSMVANLKRAEAENAELSRKMIHVAKMASMGELAATVAHEINNPLGGILTYIKLFNRQIEAGPMTEEQRTAAAQQLELVINEVKRCGNIVKNLLHFSRSPHGSIETVSMHDIINKSLLITNHHFEINGINVAPRLAAKDPFLACNANQIQQALIALFINAVEAMGHGGTLTVSTDEVRDQDALWVRVQDTGKGIPKEIQSSIFEPFFTTKEDVHGVGLGLSVVYGIVLGHQGTIKVESEPGEGATFIITLPRQRRPESAQEAASIVEFVGSAG